jgi:carboxyl-terminal processing protease
MKKSILILLLVSFLIACQTNDDISITYEEGTNEYVNEWIYAQMKRYYYWNESMPGKGDLSLYPKAYFTTLLHTDDPFSYAIHTASAETFPKSLSGLFGFDVSFVEHDGQVFGVVLYVLSGSPAENSGLHRGQLITAIDNIILNQENCDNLYQNLMNTENATLQVVAYFEESGFTDLQQVNIHKGFTFLQPVYHQIITEQNNKVGYIEIPHFDIGLSQSLLLAFQDFKNQDVNEIVVDLRYNGGGDVSSATALSILLSPNIQPSDPFITFKGNSNGGQINQTFKEALEMNESQVSFESLRAAHPSIQKVYILCGNRTASASEIIINNLKPYMEVITIGKKTFGKDMASFSIEDDRVADTDGRWVLYPAIYKLSNANGEGNYSNGIPPSIILDELQSLEVFPLGDVNEVLLHQALAIISGNGRVAQGKNTIVNILDNTQPKDAAKSVIIKKIWPVVKE